MVSVARGICGDSRFPGPGSRSAPSSGRPASGSQYAGHRACASSSLGHAAPGGGHWEAGQALVATLAGQRRRLPVMARTKLTCIRALRSSCYSKTKCFAHLGRIIKRGSAGCSAAGANSFQFAGRPVSGPLERSSWSCRGVSCPARPRKAQAWALDTTRPPPPGPRSSALLWTQPDVGSKATAHQRGRPLRSLHVVSGSPQRQAHN